MGQATRWSKVGRVPLPDNAVQPAFSFSCRWKSLPLPGKAAYFLLFLQEEKAPLPDKAARLLLFLQVETPPPSQTAAHFLPFHAVEKPPTPRQPSPPPLLPSCQSDITSLTGQPNQPSLSVGNQYAFAALNEEGFISTWGQASKGGSGAPGGGYHVALVASQESPQIWLRHPHAHTSMRTHMTTHTIRISSRRLYVRWFTGSV